MLGLVLVKGDARHARQSSWLGRFDPSRYVRLAFASFVFAHLGLQAYRASSDGLIPQAGFELEPGVVAIVLLLVWVPFLWLSLRDLSNLPGRRGLPSSPQARALALLEPYLLSYVLLFALGHGALLAWPLLTGRALPTDVRPELVATLSGTWRGVPVASSAFLVAVGAGSFYATRQALRALPFAGPALRGALTLLGVIGYVLGSYAVIRCASGTLMR